MGCDQDSWQRPGCSPALFSHDTGLRCHHPRKDPPSNPHNPNFPPLSIHRGLTNCSSELQSGLGRGFRLYIFHRLGLSACPVPGAGSRMTDFVSEVLLSSWGLERDGPDTQSSVNKVRGARHKIRKAMMGAVRSFWELNGSLMQVCMCVSVPIRHSSFLLGQRWAKGPQSQGFGLGCSSVVEDYLAYRGPWVWFLAFYQTGLVIHTCNHL